MPARFSSIFWLSTPSFSCRTSQVRRSVSCMAELRQAAKGTKDSASRPSSTSVDKRSHAPIPISRVSSSVRTTAVEKYMRTPSRSSIPTVIRSPECVRSWNENGSRCTFS